MDPASRREFLRAGVRWATVAGGAALAGCNAFEGGRPAGRTPYAVPSRTDDPTSTPAEVTGGGSTTQAVNFQSLSLPVRTRPTYRRWLPPPSRLFPGQEGYRLRYARPFRAGLIEPNLPDRFAGHRRVKLGLDHFGVGFDRYRSVLLIAAGGSTRAAVVVAPFDRAAVADALVGTGYGRIGAHRGADLFARDDQPRAVALDEGSLAWASAVRREAEPSPRAVVTRLVDAGAGEAPRYHEVDAGFETFSRVSGAPLAGTFHTGSMARDYRLWEWDLRGLVGWASDVAFDRRNTYLRNLFAFDGPKDRERLAARLRDSAASEWLFRGADGVDVTASDRWARVVAAVDDDRYHDLTSGGEPAPGITYPQITWGYEYDPGAGELTIAHRGGDAVAASTLTVDASGGDVTDEFADEYTVVRPGDALTVDLRPAGGSVEHVRIRWLSPDRREGAVLGRYWVP